MIFQIGVLKFYILVNLRDSYTVFLQGLAKFFFLRGVVIMKSYYWNKFCFPLDYLTIINTLSFTVLVFGFCDRMFKKKRKAKSVRYGVIRNVLKFELNLIKKKE